MRFKSFLQEKAMHGRAYAEAFKALGDDLLVGFEVEMLITTSSPLFMDDSAATSVRVQDLDDIEKWFNSSYTKTVRRAFEEWKDAQADDYADRNWEDHVDEDTDEDAARMAAAQVWYDDNSQEYRAFDDFVKDVYGRDGLAHLISDYDLDPIHGWEDRDHLRVYTTDPSTDNQSPTFTSLAHELEVIGIDAIVADSKQTKKDVARWYIEPDGSISSADLLDVGAELVSPPMPVQQALSTIKQVFDFMDAFDVETNESTAIHIGISVPNIKNADWLKLVLFADEQHVLKQFDRTDNINTTANIQKIRKRLVGTTLPNSIPELRDLARAQMQAHKYTGFNFEKLESGYIEVRMAGGANYHRRLEDITNLIGRLAVSLRLAMDPHMERAEYAKKLVRLKAAILKGEKASLTVSINRYLDPLINLTRQTLVQFTYYEQSPDVQHFGAWLMVVLEELARVEHRVPTKVEQEAIKRYISKNGMLDELTTYLDTPSLRDVARAWGI